MENELYEIYHLIKDARENKDWTLVDEAMEYIADIINIDVKDDALEEDEY
jgi:hypothetical protein